MMQSTPVAAPAINPQQQQQQWMMMQPAPQGAFCPPQSQSQQYPQQLSSADEMRTVWIGDLEDWMDETYLHTCFASTQALHSVKIIRNKQTGESEGYGFLEFATHAAAEMVLLKYYGTQMPSTAQRLYRLNWAAIGIVEKKHEDYPIFVTNLAFDVTGYFLKEIFRAVYGSVKAAHVVTDMTTGRSKGYGFVTFGDENEQVRAMTEMNGYYCFSKRMRICPARRKTPYPKLVAPDDDPNNTTLFVRGLDPTVTEEMLAQPFSQVGELVDVRIDVGKPHGFVTFSNRACAEMALQILQDTVFGQQAIKLSWARNPTNEQVQPADWVQTQQPYPNQWSGASYGDGQGYGYASQQQVQDPNMSSSSQDRNMYSYSQYPPENLYPHEQPYPNQWSGASYDGGQGYGYASQQQVQYPNMSSSSKDRNMYSYSQYPPENLYPHENYQQQ